MARTRVMERLTITIPDVYKPGGCSVPGMTDRREMDRVFDCAVPGAQGCQICVSYSLSGCHVEHLSCLCALYAAQILCKAKGASLPMRGHTQAR